MAFYVSDNPDLMTLDQYLLADLRAAYLLQMRGSRLEHIGIYDGDYLVVERGALPRPSDLVVTADEEGFSIQEFSEGIPNVEAVVKSLIRKFP